MRVKTVKNIVLSSIGMGLLITTVDAMMDETLIKGQVVPIPYHPELDYSQEYRQQYLPPFSLSKLEAMGCG